MLEPDASKVAHFTAFDHLGVCSHLISTIWQTPPSGLKAGRVWDHCPASCKRCGIVEQGPPPHAAQTTTTQLKLTALVRAFVRWTCQSGSTLALAVALTLALALALALALIQTLTRWACQNEQTLALALASAPTPTLAPAPAPALALTLTLTLTRYACQSGDAALATATSDERHGRVLNFSVVFRALDNRRVIHLGPHTPLGWMGLPALSELTSHSIRQEFRC